MKKKAKAKRFRFPVLWALFDAEGEFCGVYMKEEEAHDEAWGPRFLPTYKVAKYTRELATPWCRVAATSRVTLTGGECTMERKYVP